MKFAKRFWALVLCAVLTLSVIPFSVSAETPGSCGENATWEYSDGVLTISGNGPMEDYINGSAPWYDYRESIT